jgi:hypothetical protein
MSTINLTGLYHLQVKSVAVFLGGLDMGNYLVDVVGTVTVPFGADAGGLCTPEYLISISGTDLTAYGESTAQIDISTSGGDTVPVFVPCVIGNPWSTAVTLLRQNGADTLKTQQGPALGVSRKSYMYSLLLNNATGNINVGTTNGTSAPAELLNNGTAVSASTLFSGVVWGVLNDPYSFDSQLTVQVDRPTPMTLVSAGQFIDAEER